MNNAMTVPFEQHTQRNQVISALRERELWNQLIGMGSRDDCETNETERPIQYNRVSENEDNAGEKGTIEQETQTKIFVNAQGERVLAIKSAFGVKYLKIGEVQDPLLVNSNAGTESPQANLCNK